MRTTRRDFLHSTLLGSSLSWTVPSFLAATFDHLAIAEGDKSTSMTTGKDAPILVVLQLAGGNDGLNCVVPFSDDNYHRSRPRLGLKPDKVLKLNDQVGLHPALKGFRQLYDDAHLGIIQAVGYPNPNRSHFRSTEIWQTASDANKFAQQGWIGRYFDHACRGADPTVGVAIGRQLPQSFAAESTSGIALDSPSSNRSVETVDSAMPTPNSDRGHYDQTLELSEDSGGSIGMLSGSRREIPGSAMDFLERTALDARVSSDLIRTASQRISNGATYPGGRLPEGLKLVARLIGGGLSTRVYYVSQGGYDTHANQQGAHDRLLRELSESILAFVNDLKSQGNLDRVVIMTFSEFGRRVSENASIGTDHGAAAPLFVIGSKIQPGLHGLPPGLSPSDLVNGDVRFRVDFRSVYAGILERWLGTPSGPVLGRAFPPAEVIRHA